MGQRKPETEAVPLDPIALSLAVWLGLMVGALGLQHMSEQAALQAAQQAAARQNAPAHPTAVHAFAAWNR